MTELAGAISSAAQTGIKVLPQYYNLFSYWLQKTRARVCMCVCVRARVEWARTFEWSATRATHVHRTMRLDLG